VIPYAAFAVFILGFCCRIIRWAWTPVPFRIPTTCGQQRSLPWIKNSRLENPSTILGVMGRMALEILLFRSLFRNSRSDLNQGRFIYSESKALWLSALAFHWGLFIIVLRHLRLLVEPVPHLVLWISSIDGWFQIGMPELYISDILVIAGGLYLLYRRFNDPVIRFLSQFADYFALLLLLSIAGTGILMRYWFRADVVTVKRYALGLATFHPFVPAGLSAIFAIHLALVCTLAFYFPFGKLMHSGGAFLSPTRNLANNSRSKRHINPWNQPVKTHTYAEWEQEFAGKMKAAGIPLDEVEK
jgi:nitrate reductase gamma subunit